MRFIDSRHQAQAMNAAFESTLAYAPAKGADDWSSDES